MNNFTLPEKWSIRITKENEKIVGEYFSIVSNAYLNGFVNCYLGSLNDFGESVKKVLDLLFLKVELEMVL